MASADPHSDFEGAVRDFSPMVARIASSYEADAAVAEELVQDTFTALWRALPSFRGDGSLKAFVARIAHNVSVSHVRRSARASKVAIEHDLPDDGPAPDALTEQDALRRELLAAVRGLPLSYRQVITLHLEGFSNTEIADTLALSASNVGARLTRARDRLREALGAHHEA